MRALKPTLQAGSVDSLIPPFLRHPCAYFAAEVVAAKMSSAVEKKDQAVESARAKTDDIKPAVTTEENKNLKDYSKALLEQAIEIGKGNEHYDKYNFVQLPYAKLQNGSKHQSRYLLQYTR